jgi:polar amino acid transport system substrate-binding protein
MAAELRILSHRLPPFTSEAAAAGEGAAPPGLAVEIISRLLTRTGDTGTLTVEPFPRMLQDIQAGPMTMGFIVARTPPRERLMQWVGPLVVNGVYLYKKAGSPVAIATLEDARRLEGIGVTREDADHRFLREQGFTNLQISESQQLDLRRVLLGRVDVTPIGEMAFAAAVSALGLRPGDFERTPVKLFDSEVYIAFSPDVPARIIASWSAALQAFKSSDEFKPLLARYGIDATTASPAAMPNAPGG